MSKELIGVKFPPYGDFKTGISSLVPCWGALQSSYCCNLTLFTLLDTRFSRLTSIMMQRHKFVWHYTPTTSLILKLQTKSKAIIFKQFMKTVMTQKHESLMTNTVGQSLSNESILLKLSLHHFKTLVLNLLTLYQGFQGHLLISK